MFVGESNQHPEHSKVILPTHPTHNPESRHKQNRGDNRQDWLPRLSSSGGVGLCLDAAGPPLPRPVACDLGCEPRFLCALLHRVPPRFKACHARLLERRLPDLLLL